MKNPDAKLRRSPLALMFSTETLAAARALVDIRRRHYPPQRRGRCFGRRRSDDLKTVTADGFTIDTEFERPHAWSRVVAGCHTELSAKARLFRFVFKL